MNVRVLRLRHLFRRVNIGIEQSASLDSIPELDKWPVQFEHSAYSRYGEYERKGDLQPSQVESGLLKPGFRNRLRGLTLLNLVKSINFDGLFCMHEYFFRVRLLILHAIFKVHGLVPFREGAFEASGALGFLFKL